MTEKSTYEQLTKRISELEQEISEHKNVETFLRQVVDIVPIPIFVKDIDGRFLFVNKVVAENIGRTVSDVTGQLQSDLHPDNDELASIFKDDGFKTINSGELCNVSEERFTLADGTYSWWHTIKVPHVSILSDKPALLGVAVDITDRKLMEDALRENQAQLTQAQKIAHFGNWVWDIVNNKIQWSDELYRIVELEPNAFEATYEAYLKFIHPGDLDYFKSQTEKVLKEKKPYIVEYRLITSKGNTRWVNEQGELAVDAKGNPLSLFGMVRDITEQKQAVNVLEESERRFRTVLETLELIAITLDKNGILQFCNAFFLKLTGWKREEIIGKGWFETLIPEEVRDQIEQSVFLTTIQTGAFPANYKNEIVTKDGDRRLINWNNTIFRDQNDIVHTVTSIGEDITDRKIAEDDLRKSQERYSAMFKHISSGVAIYQPIDNGKDFIFLAFNKAAEKITNSSREDVVGKSILELFPNMGKSGVLGALQRVSKTGVAETIPPFYYEDEVRKGWRENRIYKLPAGEIVALFDDVTHRIEAEEALQKSEKKYRSMMEAMKDEAYINSSDCRIEYMNPRMIRKMGRDAVGELCYKAIYNQDKRCPWCVADQVLQGQHVEYEMVNPVDHHYYSVSHSPIRHSGQSVSKLTILRDITNEKMIEQQLRQSHKMEAIGTLSGGIAHEFNNMLGIILGNAELAIDDIPEWNPAADSIQEIRTASLRAKDVVRKLMRVARQTTDTKKPIQIKTIVRESLDLLRRTIPTTIDIQLNLICSTEMILADSTEINQILMNLCSNSAHAIGEKTGIIEVNLETVELDHRSATHHKKLEPGEYAKLVIEDSGSGIEPQIMERIFDPYFTTKDIDEGLGMGLAIVLGIVDKHDGSINFETQVGKGTRVEILFPLIEAQSEEAKETPEALPHGIERILVVDDESSIVKMMTRMLEGFGYDVIGVTSSIDALELFLKDPDYFDLVISDMAMPGMAGNLLAKKMIQANPDIPIILCTGYSDHANEGNSLKIGIKALVYKPIVKADLAKTIRNVLDATSGKVSA